MSLEAASAAITAALRAGVDANAIAAALGEAAGWERGPTIVCVRLSSTGRHTQIAGVIPHELAALELRYVDQRWHTASAFYTPCGIGSRWATRLDMFLRRFHHPILLSRHGASRDYVAIAAALTKASIPQCPPLRGCSARALSRNGAFPVDPAEVAAYLNVLAVTPAKIEQNAVTM